VSGGLFDDPRDEGPAEKPPKPKPPKQEPPPRSRSTSSTSKSSGDHSKRGRRKRQAQETILELVDVMDAFRGRGNGADPHDVADVGRRDAELMAETLAAAADRFQPLAVAMDHLMGAGGPLSFLRAFGPIARAVMHRLRSIRQQRDELALQFERALLDAAGAGPYTAGQRVTVFSPQTGRDVELEYRLDPAEGWYDAHPDGGLPPLT